MKLRVLRQVFARRQQHRRMPVVAAQMRHAGDLALVGKIVVLLDRECVGVGAQSDGLRAIACGQGRDDAVLADALHDVVAPGSHQVGDVLRRLALLRATVLDACGGDGARL